MTIIVFIDKEESICGKQAWAITSKFFRYGKSECGKFYPKKVIQIGYINKSHKFFYPEELSKKNLIQRLTWPILQYFIHKKQSPKNLQLRGLFYRDLSIKPFFNFNKY